tara:strand:+ start:497 stop:1219 length:723 start_codon:yes stop_codon:yes gene_type:complete
MTTLFVSDLHLDNTRPEVVNYFLNYLKSLSTDIDSLYILGDFVEYWVGDDDPAEGLTELFEEIKNRSRIHDIYFMHGNRDFMISESFCEKLGMKLIPDPSIVSLYGKKILLMHGDTLCTDDHEYQDFRKLVRSDLWQQEALKKTVDERIILAKELRQKSLKETGAKKEIIMDVNENEVDKTFLKYDVRLIIHGHTHRPNIHTSKLKGEECKRIVLGDWYNSSFILKYQKDKILIEKTSFI